MSLDTGNLSQAWSVLKKASKTVVVGVCVVIFAQLGPANFVQAEPNLVQNIQLQATSTGLDIILETQGSDLPKVVTLNRGNSWIAEITNAQLKLPQGGTFHRDRPTAGIDSVTIIALDNNTIQVLLTKSSGTITSQVKRLNNKNIVLSLTKNLQAPSVSIQPEIEQQAPTNNFPPNSSTKPPVTPPTPVPEPPNTAKASAPPVGDISIGSVEISASKLSLGTSLRIPNLVLRDAPIREVLSVIASTAGLNLVFLEGNVPNAPGTPQPTPEPNISLDIKNESAENIFNYVLQVSRLQASREGNTILIGRTLPATSRGVIVRNIRLNQLKATIPETTLNTTISSGASLTTGGGGGLVTDRQTTTNSQISRTSAIAQKIPIKGAVQILEDLGANGGATVASTTTPAKPNTDPSQLLLNGLQATADSRTNSVTLIGTPNIVQIAIDYLRQLDIRRRQVSVNVKIVEVSLDKNENIGSSFSFGVDESFFSVNQGAANANFGRLNPSFIPSPPNNPLSPTVVQSPINIGGIDGITRVLEFPSKFLLNLQARVISNEAKILTDPTLIVQEGGSSQVNLTSQVFAGFRQITEPAPGNTVRNVSETKDPIDVGVILNITVDQIDDNGFVTLAVSPEVSSPGERITDPSRNDLLVQQLVNRRRLDTGNVRLRNGQTLVLTGIIQETDRTIVSKTPILGDIPLLGILFRRTDNERSRNEVIVLVTPTIME